MVIYFESNVATPPAMIYMGVDKYENEELLKWGFPEDVWFHVDKMSSAHVYLRMSKDMTIDTIPPLLLEDCAQLVKANSIQGSKANNVQVVYTMFGNLKKTQGMDVGQVGFHSDKEVRTVKVERKINETLNRLNKTRQERTPDLRLEREQRDREERELQKQLLREKQREEQEERRRKKEESELRSYKSLMKDGNMTSNQRDVDYKEFEDDFM
ncbi:coiled-coil domain-containing protein 25-like [Dysidea avara]|uniref:coiled-coil domain-containing protein 25-like n=1 Tax=Dysidea avara TaxID=196820 RepID=UPI00331DB3B1